MPADESIRSHYTQHGLLNAIHDGIAALGKSPETVSIDDLAAVDEFHVGGREATRALLDQVGLDAGARVLDVGCGIGGAARFVATAYGCTVVGVDLTPDYVTVGNALCALTGLDARVRLVCSDATDTPFDGAHFVAAYMLHVGMNIADKSALAREVFRVLEPGGTFAIYDLMRTGDGEPAFPLPWASEPASSALAAPATYREALAGAGFEIVAERDRRDAALAAVHRMQDAMRGRSGPPPLGLHLLMGAAAPLKYANMVAAIESGLIAPVELLARKADAAPG